MREQECTFGPRPRAARVVGLLLLLGPLCLGGCSAWETVAPPGEKEPGAVFVTLRDSTRFKVESAYGRADTLFGIAEWEHAYRLDPDFTRWAIRTAACQEAILVEFREASSRDSSLVRGLLEMLPDSLAGDAVVDSTVAEEDAELLFLSLIYAFAADPCLGPQEVAIPRADIERIEQRPVMFKVMETTALIIATIGALALAGWAESYQPD